MAEMQFAMRGVGSADDLIDQTTADPSGAATVDLSLDQLNYMSDLISEMRDMSRKARLATLSGILALALLEANQQIAIRCHA